MHYYATEKKGLFLEKALVHIIQKRVCAQIMTPFGFILALKVSLLQNVHHLQNVQAG
jgi:hypothetical protein